MINKPRLLERDAVASRTANGSHLCQFDVRLTRLYRKTPTSQMYFHCDPTPTSVAHLRIVPNAHDTAPQAQNHFSAISKSQRPLRKIGSQPKRQPIQINLRSPTILSRNDAWKKASPPHPIQPPVTRNTPVSRNNAWKKASPTHPS
jgi:hypothetical protein